jgi:hypothetical protein
VAMLHCRILQLLYQMLGCDLTMFQSWENNFCSSYFTMSKSSKIFNYFQNILSEFFFAKNYMHDFKQFIIS